MPKLSDGSVVPGHYRLTTTAQRDTQLKELANRNYGLHVGYVVAVHYPTDPGYTSFKNVVYDVVASVSNGGSGSYAWQVYSNLTWGASLGGSTNDFMRFRIRTPTSWVRGSIIDDTLISQSSKVIFACDNGRSQNGIILGLAEHPSLLADDKTLGHYYKWSFNGINQLINKDGEYSLEYSGAILDPGTNSYTAPSSNAGTYIKLDKSGSFIADDAAGESIKLDKSGQQISISARQMTTNTTSGDWNLYTKGKSNVKAQGNAVFNSGNKVFIGNEGSTEPLVRGNILATALEQLANALLTPPLIGQAGPFPVMLHPVVRTLLLTWKSIYAQKDVSPFLSRKGYVE